jgi:hydroxymethylglutaryl-CoA lyase
LANIYAALETGISIFHSSIAGLGGCPYAKGATGNVATEDVVYLLAGLGIETGVQFADVARIGAYITQAINRPNHSRAGKAFMASQ